MSTPEQDLNVGLSIATDMCVPLMSAGQKMPSSDARARMYMGAACALGGVMLRAIGKRDAVLALHAAIAAVEGQP